MWCKYQNLKKCLILSETFEVELTKKDFFEKKKKVKKNDKNVPYPYILKLLFFRPLCKNNFKYFPGFHD